MNTVTDLIKDEFKGWTNDNIIFITAGTGMGKSYFVKNTLYDYCKNSNKKICLFSNRTNLLNQNKEELKDKDNNIIDMYNYQKLDYQGSHIKPIDENDKYINLNDYDYIVADECHYFLDDASFNLFTDVSLKEILSCNAVKIFMSATPRTTKMYIENELEIKNIKEYTLKTNYNTYVDNFFIYKDEEYLEKILLHDLQEDEKVIFFHKSAKKCYELHKKFKNSLFLCSKNNDLYSKVDREKIDNMLLNCKFDEQILFTTKCFDNGVNLIDRDIKHIIINMGFDYDTIIQCIGRKRIIDEDDKVSLYIKNVSNEELGGKIQGNKNKLLMADTLEFIGEKDYILNNPRNHKDNIIYVDIENNVTTLKINKVIYYKTKDDISFAEALLKMSRKTSNRVDKKYPFAKYLKVKLGVNWCLYDNLYEFKTFEEYLNDIVGVRLDKQGQEDLKEMFNKVGLQDRTMGINTLNGKLKDLNLKYQIKTERKMINGNRNTFWIVTNEKSPTKNA